MANLILALAGLAATWLNFAALAQVAPWINPLRFSPQAGLFLGLISLALLVFLALRELKGRNLLPGLFFFFLAAAALPHYLTWALNLAGVAVPGFLSQILPDFTSTYLGPWLLVNLAVFAYFLGRGISSRGRPARSGGFVRPGLGERFLSVVFLGFFLVLFYKSLGLLNETVLWYLALNAGAVNTLVLGTYLLPTLVLLILAILQWKEGLRLPPVFNLVLTFFSLAVLLFDFSGTLRDQAPWVAHGFLSNHALGTLGFYGILTSFYSIGRR